LLSAIKNIPVAEVYDALGDENVKDVLDDKADLDEEELEEKEEEEEEEIDLENILSEIDISVMSAQTVAQNHLLKAMTLSVNVESYYAKKINGGVYKESVSLKDKQLPDNKRGARMGLAQQQKHNEMVEMQYNLGD